MTVSRDTVLKRLPVFRDKWITVKAKQRVPDIIDSMLQSHRDFARQYDAIGPMFAGDNIEQTCENLFHFCKDNIRYREESENEQSTAIPAGILVRGEGDCKHYASFIAGCLDAINRSGTPIKWEYCFASYKKDQKTPYHVFVIAQDEKGEEIWIDPTPGAADMVPVWWVRVK